MFNSIVFDWLWCIAKYYQRSRWDKSKSYITIATRDALLVAIVTAKMKPNFSRLHRQYKFVLIISNIIVNITNGTNDIL